MQDSQGYRRLDLPAANAAQSSLAEHGWLSNATAREIGRDLPTVSRHPIAREVLWTEVVQRSSQAWCRRTPIFTTEHAQAGVWLVRSWKQEPPWSCFPFHQRPSGFGAAAIHVAQQIESRLRGTSSGHCASERDQPSSRSPLLAVQGQTKVDRATIGFFH